MTHFNGLMVLSTPLKRNETQSQTVCIHTLCIHCQMMMWATYRVCVALCDSPPTKIQANK